MSRSLLASAHWWPWALGTMVAIFLLWILLKAVRYYRLARRHYVTLDVTPPPTVTKDLVATQQLFSLIHALKAPRSFVDHLLGCKDRMLFEILSTREGGIRYVVTIEEALVAPFTQLAFSYIPELKVSPYAEQPPTGRYRRTVAFRQTAHFAFPLATSTNLLQHDPVAYFTGVMTQLAPEESIRFQLIVEPTNHPSAKRLLRRIHLQQDAPSKLSAQKSLLSRGLYVLNSLVFFMVDTVTASTQPITYSTTKHQRPLSTFEHEVVRSMYHKLDQPLYQANIRAVVVARSRQEVTARLRAVISSLAVFSVPSYQALRPSYRFRVLQYVQQHVSLSGSMLSLHTPRCVLSAGEIASLYHFPIHAHASTENLVVSLSKTLPAPLSLKQAQGFDIVLGRNYHHGSKTDIGLTAAERERHVYIIGGTGNGKTTMLQHAIVQDIQNGKGLAVIDPHGDLAEMVLRHIPPERVKDVVYINPDDLSHPIGFNLLELPEGVSGDGLLRERDLVVESVVSVFRKIFSDDGTGGHRIEYILRNAVHTALTIENATLFTVLKLLQNSSYRREHTKGLADEDLRDFWREEYGKAGSMQRVKMSAGATAKLGRFRHSAPAARMLGQVKSTVDFEDIINSGKILICNFSKGLLGEDVSELFGITVLAKLQLAALRRARMPSDQRHPFYLYVDEFQNFATSSFVQMLSEARKYKLFLTMAEQSTSQQKDQQMVQVILANVGTVICFRTGNPVDEQLFLPLFSPYIEKGEIANLPAFSFYAKLSAVLAQEPVSGRTLLLEGQDSPEMAQAAINHSRAQYTAFNTPLSSDNKEEDRNGVTSTVLDDDHLGIAAPTTT